MKIALVSLILALAAAGNQQPAGDAIFDAMNDELARSVTQLKIGKHDRPYFVSYNIDQWDTLDIDASFGAFTLDQQARTRLLGLDVRVGDYHVDSGNMRRRYMAEFRHSGKVSLDDDYDAIRHKLWLSTDAAYKDAVEGLERKKAIMQQRNEKERPDDWSKEEPLVLIQPKQEFHPDRSGWAAKIKSLSAIFKEYPRVRQSDVTFRELQSARYYVNNEGSKSRVYETLCIINATATAQASDGRKIGDSIVIASMDE
ncbi:MAG: hypothetical protein ACRD3W_10165, partial [Terriglobales bacterium]